ncbi:MAG: GTP-binding protein [Ardenticatenaceae bacterium]|nr:GTP-binding protein [Ardenticatenaceae bacterium]
MKEIQKKVCLLGDIAVGKSSLVRRFVEGIFDDKYLSTMGVHVSRKVITQANHQLKLLVWDLAGGEDFTASSTINYLRGAAGAILVCDLTRENTLETLATYAQMMLQVNPTAVFVIVGNKADLSNERIISDLMLSAHSKNLKCPYLSTSAKTGERVEDAFHLLAAQLEN